MKNIKLSSIVVLLLAMLFITSCIDDGKDDFDTPDLTIVDPNIADENIINMNAIAGQLFNENNGNTETVSGGNVITINEYIDIFDDRFNIIPVTFDETGNYISGYVISSDEAGNFFEELIIQDKLENPTFGIKINVNVNPLFTKFVLGRKVFIKLDGLSISVANGLLTLGVLDSNGRLEKISESLLDEYIIRSPELGTIIPKLIDLTDPNLVLSTNQFVAIEDLQFKRDQIFPEIATFAANILDEFDGERFLESCVESSGSIILSTSTFSDFTSLTLPIGRGVIHGVLSQNFFGNTLNLNINFPSDINFNGDRCDPFQCTGESGGGSAIFEENFESFSGYNAEGWTSINVSDGNTDWIVGDYQGNSYAQISGFNSGEDVITSWLVTPTINMDNTTGEELNFDIQVNYDNGNILKVMASTNFTGDVTTANWVELETIIPGGPSGGFGDFESVEPTNISCLDGEINIAFLYKGSDPTATTRYHIDNIEITGN